MDKATLISVVTIGLPLAIGLIREVYRLVTAIDKLGERANELSKVLEHMSVSIDKERSERVDGDTRLHDRIDSLFVEGTRQ